MQISVVVLVVGLLSGWIEGRGGYRNALLGALLFELASIIDGCDGENARLTFRGSKLGGTFDITGDAATFVFFFMNLPIGLYRSTRSDLWLVLGVVSFVSMFLFYLQVGKYTKRTGIGNNIVAIVKDIEKSGSQPGFTGSLDRTRGEDRPRLPPGLLRHLGFHLHRPGRGAGLHGDHRRPQPPGDRVHVLVLPAKAPSGRRGGLSRPA